MNKQVIMLISALGISAPLIASTCCVPKNTGSCDSCTCKAIAKTFFNVRPQFQDVMPERQTFMRDRMWAKADGHHGVFSFTFYGGQSTDSGRYAAYFGPSCGNEWSVKEAQPVSPWSGDADILPQYFNIATKNESFESKISFAPQQSVFGIGLHWKQSLVRDEKEKGCFIEVSMPIEHVTNTMGFKEQIINDGGGALNDSIPGSMTEAFVQPAFHYGRIYSSENCAVAVDSCPSSVCYTSCDNGCVGCNLDQWGLADIDVRLGYETVKCDTVTLDSFIGVIIPTGNKPRARNVFEPIVGHNHHPGFSFGTYTGIQIWENECKERRVWASANVYALYLFQNTQKRLIDLYNKPWSRYMNVYLNIDQATQAYNKGNAATPDPYAFLISTPGVNVFAQDVCVNPGFQISCNTALVYWANKCNAELGCNFFAREAECVKLACCWKEGPAFKSLNETNLLDGYTDNVQTINSNYQNRNALAPVYYDLNLIKESDLDLNSASHPAILTYNIYGALGYRNDECEYPRFAGIGGSYEFAPDNSGLDRWLIWAKAGLSY